MEVVHSDTKKLLLGVVDNHVVVEENDHDEIGIEGFYFNSFDKDEEGIRREG